MKEFTVKTCRRCGASWYGDSASTTLVHGDQLTMIMVKIVFCDICKDPYDKELNAPNYRRVPRKKK